MEALFLQVLQQGAAGPVHNTFRRTGRARGIQDVEWVIERQLSEFDISCVVRSDEMPPVGPIRNAPDRGIVRQQGKDNGHLHTWQIREHFRNFPQRVERLAIVVVPGNGKQNLWLNLPEPVEHTLVSEVRRT